MVYLSKRSSIVRSRGWRKISLLFLKCFKDPTLTLISNLLRILENLKYVQWWGYIVNEVRVMRNQRSNFRVSEKTAWKRPWAAAPLRPERDYNFKKCFSNYCGLLTLISNLLRILENLKYVQIGPKLVIRALKLLFKGMENIKKRIRKRQNRKKKRGGRVDL